MLGFRISELSAALISASASGAMSEARQAAGFPGYAAAGGCQQRGMSNPEVAPPSHRLFCRTPLPVDPGVPGLRGADTTAAAALGHGGFVPTLPALVGGKGKRGNGAACRRLGLPSQFRRAEGWSPGPAGGCRRPEGPSPSWERRTSLMALTGAGAQAGGDCCYLEVPEETSPAGEGSEEGIPPDAPLLRG